MSFRMHMLYGGAQNGSNMLQDEVFPIHGQFPGKYKYTVSGKLFFYFCFSLWRFKLNLALPSFRGIGLFSSLNMYE